MFQSIFGMHDSSKFEVFCYALSAPDGSFWRRRIEAEAEHFKDISLLHAGDAAQLISNDGVHMLVNLNGYTKGARNEIFALHPAPVQISFLGFAGTMGADYIEYVNAYRLYGGYAVRVWLFLYDCFECICVPYEYVSSLEAPDLLLYVSISFSPSTTN